MENRSLVTIAEHSKEKILYMLEMAKQFEMNPNRRLLQGKVVATKRLPIKPAKFQTVYFRHDNVQYQKVERFVLKDFPTGVSVMTDGYRMSELF